MQANNTYFPQVICSNRLQETPSPVTRSDSYRQAICLGISRNTIESFRWPVIPLIAGPGGFSAPQHPPPAFCPGAPRQ